VTEAPAVESEVTVAEPEVELEEADLEGAGPERAEEPEQPAELQAVAEEISPAEAAEETEIEDLDRFVASQRSYVQDHPENHAARLELGRILWQADKREDAVAAYEQLVHRGELLGDVIGDLENYAEQEADPGVLQALGDAYMRADHLQEALDTYRRALASL
jgi:tetratricopeptide (TPR) repeat protein